MFGDIFNAMMEKQQPQQPQMGPPKPQMGPPAPGPQMPQMPQMPPEYTQNRMAEMGMPAIAQIGESLIDKYRANKWSKENQTEVDEFGGETVGSTPSPEFASGQDPASAKGSGIFDGGDMFSKLFKMMV